MTHTPWRLVRRHLVTHWLRSSLTIAAMCVAVFLFCFLISIVTSLDDAVKESASNRLVVQSAVSLFVNLPLGYQTKVEAVPGVEKVSKVQWFGAYYQSPENFFAQFAVDHDPFFEMYTKDLEIIVGPDGNDGPGAREAALAAIGADRRGAIVGEALAREFGWNVGDTVPLIGTIFQKSDGKPWEFNIAGLYRPLRSNVDGRTFWFRFDYVEETLRAALATGPRGAGTFFANLREGAEPGAVSAEIDRLFENGPQVTKTTTEAAFQAGFTSMMGNLPMFLGTIGGAVLFAVLFSVVNTMLMAARQRFRETGILKALGFRDGALARLMLAESLTITLAGGLLGTALIAGLAPGIRMAFARFLPTFAVTPRTLLLGLAIAAGIGLLAGSGPAFIAGRLRPTEALRKEG
ncbi:MAG: ABC transporter permease [Planctomycetota bacterium]